MDKLLVPLVLEAKMASATKKTRRRRQAKRTKMGQGRKSEVRRELRMKMEELARRLGLTDQREKPGQGVSG